MALLEKQLYIRKSGIPHAGKGLFTQKKIPAGTRIVEYKGKSCTWKSVDHNEGRNGYIYYVNRNLVIDASGYKKAFGRYANDARGIEKIKGLLNNSIYVTDKTKVYIESVKDIPAGGEILVGYGKEYWDAIRYNAKLYAREALTPTKKKSSLKSKRRV